MCAHTHVHSSVIPNTQQVETTLTAQPQLVDGETMWSVWMVEYYSAIKRNEVLIHATTWMNLENIMLSERSQTQKTTYCLILST